MQSLIVSPAASVAGGKKSREETQASTVKNEAIKSSLVLLRFLSQGRSLHSNREASKQFGCHVWARTHTYTCTTWLGATERSTF